MKANLDATYSTLTSSINFLSSHQRELVGKTIDSTEKIWRTFLQIREEFGDLIFIDMIYTPEEIDQSFKSGHPRLTASSIKEYVREDTAMKKFERCGANDMEYERLFISEKLWILFFVYRAINGRVAWLFYKSFKEHKYIDWHDDEHFGKMLFGILPDDIIDMSRNVKIQGLHIITRSIENAFLQEAKIVFSAGRAVSENYSEVQSAMLIEKEKLQAQLQPQLHME